MALRIQKSSDGDSSVFTLSGRLEAKHVPELQKMMDADKGDIVLDLQELVLADRVSIEFLTRSEADGILIKNCPEYIREWISKTK